MPPDPQTTAASTPSKRHGFLRLLLQAGAAFAVILVLLAVLFVVGIPVPGNLARSPIEALLTDVFSVPTRIEGPLRLRTGLVAGAEVGALILADPSNPAGPPLARADGVSVRVDVLALLRRTVILEEISSKQVEVKLTRAADGRGNWAPVIATSGTPPPVQFVGIGQLKVSALKGSFAGQPGAEPVRWELKEFESALLGRNPITARGTLFFGGRTLAFDVSSTSLAELFAGPPKTIPVKAALEASGARVKVDGVFTAADTSFGSGVEITAENADTVLAALGVATRDAGPLSARGQVRVDAREVAVDKLALTLGKSSASGSARINWAGARPLIAFDMAAPLVDQTPFLTGTEPAQSGTTSPFVGIVDQIHHIATSIDLDAKASVAEFIGVAQPWRNARIESRIDNRLLAVHATGDVLGMKAKIHLEYSARSPKQTLTWHLEGGRFSTEKLPGGVRPGEVAGTLGGLRGELKASGTNAEQLVASAHLNLDARDLRFSWSHRGERPQEVHLTSARVDIASARSARAEVHGRIGGRPCTMRLAGGTLESLVAGERWPLTLDASCRGAKLVSRGHVIVKGRETTVALRFDGSANPIGPLGGALGLATDVPHDFAVSGELALTEALVDVKLTRFRLGRTAGSGTASVTREGKKPHRVELALKTVDIAEVATLAPRGEKKAPVDPLAQEVLPSNVRIPDLDLQLTAGTVRYGDEVLRKLDVHARPREGHLRDARFAFQWRGAALSGDLSADLRGKHPTIALKAAVENVELAKVVEGEGRKLPPLRAETIRATASASGVKLSELLASATAEAEIFQGRLGNVHQHVPGLIGDAEFSAKLSVKEKQPVKMSARGTVGDESFEISIDTEPLEKLAQSKGRLPGKLHASLGEIRLEASGDISSEGALDAHVTLSGRRLERLGRLGGVQLPETEPFTAVADLAVAADSIRASGIDAKFGKSQVLGKVSMNRAGTRPAIAAELRSPVLHLEDLGLHILLGTGGKQKTATTSAPPATTDTAQKIAQFENSLRALDAKATLNVEALYSEGKRYASLRASTALKDGKLHVAVHDMYVSAGKANADLHIDASVSGSRLYLRALTEGFEYGPLAEALKPNTPLEGTLDLSLNMSLESLHEPLFGDLDGHVSLAVFPRGLKIGAADYWGTGLLHMMQSTVDRSAESRLNCAVAIFDVKKGVARSEAFFADTTRVRIIGEIQANLITRELSGRLSPNAKNPALLTVSPSVGIGGTMESPKVELTPDSLITAPLRLVFPIHAFAFDWLKTSNVAADGSDGCRKAFNQAISVNPKKPPPPPAQPSPSFWPF